MSFQDSSLTKILSTQTPFLGIKLWITLLLFAIISSAIILLVIFLSMICFCRQKSKSKSKSFRPLLLLPNAMSCSDYRSVYAAPSSLDRRFLQSRRLSEVEMNIPKLEHFHLDESLEPCRILANLESAARASDAAWKGNRFSLRDIDVVTSGFSGEHVIGNGDYGVVYRGVLLDATRVVVKMMLSKCFQVEEFLAQVETIGHVRHKNLVKLLGFCMEGDYRLLVNEYVDNGNLHQWLHGCREKFSPLTWSIRMNIIQGVAKGLAYLHEDIEPKIVHQNLKSRNILLDHKWNPKVSDFGIVKLFSPERNRVAAHLMGTSGYLSQDDALDGVLNEKTDVYSFGILVMEIISGRFPADHNQHYVYLVDWLKSMVANQKIMYVTDPKLPEMPSSKELKRILLLAFRCVDPDINNRPTMGDVIHMLEPRDLLLNDELDRRGSSRRNCSIESLIR
ncbi:probable serine/threonine-protein kinase At1g01540 [Euphorbia lathyris]|uniref:probable serine/threonine-protein kinase At1g01540 n=1 Tax=Euphorbia lathyris TaxID=212925 RepID=UPI003313FCBD